MDIIEGFRAVGELVDQPTLEDEAPTRDLPDPASRWYYHSDTAEPYESARRAGKVMIERGLWASYTVEKRFFPAS